MYSTKSRRMRWTVHVARMGRGEDNIKMELQEVVCSGKDRIELAQDRNR